MSLKRRLANIEKQLPQPEPEPLTDDEMREEVLEQTHRLLTAAAESPGDAELQRRVAGVEALLSLARERRRTLVEAVGADPETGHDDLLARGVALIIESYSNPGDTELEGHRKAVCQTFDQMAFRYWQTPEWAAFEATPAGQAYEKRRSDKYSKGGD